MKRPSGISRLVPRSVLILLLLLPGAAFAAPLGSVRTQAPLVAPAPPPGSSAVDLANSDLRDTVARLKAGKPAPSGVKVVKGRVDVEILSALPEDTIAGFVRDAGGDVVGSVPGQLTEAYVPSGRLVSLAHRTGVQYIRPPVRVDAPIRANPTPSAGTVTASSPIVGEEVAKTNASGWQATGWTGAGVKVGIVDYFNQTSWNSAANAGEIPAAPAGSFCQMNGSACNVFGFTGSGTEHGVAVAEVIHEQAPDAKLYLATAFSTSDLQAAVNYFAGQGVKIISRSLVSEYDGPGDGTGPIGTVIGSAVSQGMAWFNGAGNNASDGSSSGSYWRGSWADANSNGFLEFAPGDESQEFACGTLINGFRWSDWGTAANRTNYDVYVYDKVVGGALSGLLASSTSDQQAGAPPIEIPHYSCDTSDPIDHMVVKLVNAGSGTAGDVLEYEQNGLGVEHWQNPFSAAGAASDSASPGALSVGAVDPPNGTTIGPYSSWGPTNDNRIKPDLSAAAGMQNFTYGTFPGTSAATPAAAGAAALVLQSGLVSNPAQLKSYLVNLGTVDRGAPGSDNTYGKGELHLTTPPALPGAYPRPKGATPIHVSLVPWFQPCGAGNRTHGAPLAFPSCAPPGANSPYLTIGTPDANGAGANFTGFVNFSVHIGAPGPPDDSDVNVTLNATDIRCRPASGETACGSANATAGADYTGQLYPLMLIRITDRSNAPSDGTSYSFPGTVQDFTHSIVAANCTATASTTVGSTCSLNTSFNAVLPGTVLDGKRAIMDMSYIAVADGGVDGQANTSPNYYFLDQGVFVP